MKAKDAEIDRQQRELQRLRVCGRLLHELMTHFLLVKVIAEGKLKPLEYMLMCFHVHRIRLSPSTKV